MIQSMYQWYCAHCGELRDGTLDSPASQIIGGLDWICPRCKSASFVFSFPVLRDAENKSDVPLDAHPEKD